MMKAPLVSVIVPVYKVENYLQRCVESIINQTYTNLEIILVDDGSPDKCPQMCDNYAHKDSRIVVIHKNNGGLSSARNAALDVVSGDFITFVDSDDYISLVMIERLIELIEKYDADIVTCGLNVIDKNAEVYDYRVVDADIKLSGVELANLLIKDKAPYNFACSKIFRKHLFDKVRYPLNRYYEDTATTYKLAYLAEKTYNTKECLYYYELGREGNITSELQTPKAVRSYKDGITNCLEQIEYCSTHCELKCQIQGIKEKMNKWFLLGLQSSTRLELSDFLDFRNYVVGIISNCDNPRNSFQLSVAINRPYIYYYCYPILRKIKSHLK